MPLVANVKVVSHIEEVKQASKAQILNWLAAVGADATGVAFDVCPHKTGVLRNSIGWQVAPEEKAVYIGTNVPYAIYQEKGTSRIAGKHFLQAGVTLYQAEYKQMLENYLKD